MSEEAAKVLHETREYIEANGWAQGTLHLHHSGAVCLYGGLFWSQGMTDVTNDDIEALVAENPDFMEFSRLLADQIYPEWRTVGDVAAHLNEVVKWNDTKGRQKQEVLDLLAKAEKVALAGFDPDA